jgi:hypothetical protein
VIKHKCGDNNLETSCEPASATTQAGVTMAVLYLLRFQLMQNFRFFSWVTIFLPPPLTIENRASVQQQEHAILAIPDIFKDRFFS